MTLFYHFIYYHAEVDVPGDKDSRWLGQTASWYIDAVKEPWSKHYQMYSYVSKELPELVLKHFPVRPKFGICGHRLICFGIIFSYSY